MLSLIGEKVKAVKSCPEEAPPTSKRSAEEAGLGAADGDVHLTVGIDDSKLVAALDQCGEAAQQGPEQFAKYLKEHLGTAVRTGAIKATSSKQRSAPYSTE